MHRIGNVKRPLVIIAALALAVALGFAASFFTGCGNAKVIITLKDGEKPVDTILTDENGVAHPDPEDYDKPGYEFIGFFNDAALTNKYAGTSFWRNATLYLGYNSLEYTITFDLAGGEFAKAGANDGASDPAVKPAPTEGETAVKTPVLDDEGNYTLKVRSGEILRVTAPTREHYDFYGWKYGGKTVDADEPFEYADDVLFVANWRAHKSTVTYDPDGGKVLNNDGDVVSSGIVRQYVDYDSVFAPYGALKTGYAFLGWFDAEENELVAADKWQTEENFAVKARYQAQQYALTVTFEGGGVTYRVVFDAAYDLSKYEKAPIGYVFDCWEYTLDGQSGTVKSSGIWNVAGNITLVPRYTPKDYKLTLMNGNEIYDAYNVAYNSEVALPDDPIENNRVFAGWFDKADGSGERLLPDANWYWNEDKVFYARFLDRAVAVSFNVEYYLENADYTGENVDVKYAKSASGYTAYGKAGETIEIDVVNFDRKFAAFGFDAADTLNSVRSATLTEDGATLKFYFRRKTVKYTFMDGGDVLRYREYRIGQTVTLGDFVPKKGYELTGWKVGNTETVIAADTADYKAAGVDTVLYAVREIKTYSVSIDGKHVFDIRYNETLSGDNKAALLLPDTADNTFDGLAIGGTRYAPADLAAMEIWTIDGDKKTADGTYALNLASMWQARKAYYTVGIWLAGEDGIFAFSQTESFEKKADIGQKIEYVNNITQITVGGVTYVFDAENENNELETIVTADNSAAIKLYFKRAG